MSTASTTYRYCPRCSALVVEAESDHCLICDLEFAGNPPAGTSPELERSRAALVEAQDQQETPKGLRSLAWLAQVTAILLRVVLAVVVALAVVAIGVAIWDAIF